MSESARPTWKGDGKGGFGHPDDKKKQQRLQKTSENNSLSCRGVQVTKRPIKTTKNINSKALSVRGVEQRQPNTPKHRNSGT
jgi:hypothetical protein